MLGLEKLVKNRNSSSDVPIKLKYNSIKTHIIATRSLSAYAALTTVQLDFASCLQVLPENGGNVFFPYKKWSIFFHFLESVCQNLAHTAAPEQSWPTYPLSSVSRVYIQPLSLIIQGYQ